jgi:transposase
VLDGASREEAAKIGGMDRQTLRDWVIRFNEQGADGLINIPSPGARPRRIAPAKLVPNARRTPTPPNIMCQPDVLDTLRGGSRRR